MAKGLFKIPPGTVLYDVQIPNTRDGGLHPHKMDVYIPNEQYTPNRVLTLLHGGGNVKYIFALQLLIAYSRNKSPNNVNWAILNDYHCVAIIPQGQYCTGIVNEWNPNGVDSRTTKYARGLPAWTNHGFWSQVDDVQYLKDLSLWIQGQYAGCIRYLAGHSAGGMMVQRMYYEAPSYYHKYMPICGPAPMPQYEPGIAFGNWPPAVPTDPRPMTTWNGGRDPLLTIWNGPMGDGDHWLDEQWVQAPKNLARIDVDFPALGIRQAELVSFKDRCNALGYNITDIFDHPNVKIETIAQPRKAAITYYYLYDEAEDKQYLDINSTPQKVMYCQFVEHSVKSIRDMARYKPIELIIRSLVGTLYIPPPPIP